MMATEIPYGYCQCGCGQKAPLAKHNYPKRGIKKGEPCWCVRNHVRKGVEHKFKRGADHYLWKGDSATDHTKRRRAENWYPEKRKCQRCGKDAYDRHHSDGNLNDGTPENILFLCRRCHMETDGRLNKFKNAMGGRGKCPRGKDGRFHAAI